MLQRQIMYKSTSANFEYFGNTVGITYCDNFGQNLILIKITNYNIIWSSFSAERGKLSEIWLSKKAKLIILCDW